MNYSPKVTANCDGTLNIELANKPGTVKYGIYIDQDGFVGGMQHVGDIDATPGPVTIHHHQSIVPDTGQASVTAVAYNADGSSSIANSTVLAEFDNIEGNPSFFRGKTYQAGVTATGTPCSGTTAPPTGGTSTGKPNSGKGNQGGKNK